MGLHLSRLLPAACLVALALGCGGNVIVDGASSRGATGSGSSGSHGTASMSGGVGGAGGSTASFVTSGVGGAGPGVGGGMSVGGNTGVGVTSGSASSSAPSSTSSSSSGAGGGPTNALWDILGVHATLPSGGFIEPPYLAVDAAGDSYFTMEYVGGPLTFATQLPCTKRLNVMVAKVSPAGQVIWSRCVSLTPVGDSLPSSIFTVSGITVTPAGEVVVLGRFSGAVDFGTGPLATSSDLQGAAFLVALDASSGAAIWAKQLDVPFNLNQLGGLSWGLASDVAGGLYIGGGDLSAPLDLGGGVSLSPSGAESAFVAKLDASGNGVWATEVSSAPSASGAPMSTVAVSADGAHCALATGFYGTVLFGGGVPSGSSNPLVVELDTTTGSVEWGLFPLGPSDTASVSSAAFGGDGSLVIAGNFRNALDLGGGPLGPPGGFVAKLDPAGALSWQHGMLAQGPSSTLALGGIAVDGNGDITYATTAFASQVTIDTHTFTCPQDSPGFWCIFLGTIDSTGHVGPADRITGHNLPPGDEHFRGPVVAFGSGEKLLAGIFPTWIDFGAGHVPNPVTSASVFLAALP